MQNMIDGINLTAAALGMSPEDLATIISYETAGSFDPTKRGPTTQWGQHRGLIQFGEPQARQYGVDWNDPMGSQLGENGAIVRYFRDNGWQPGMGMLDAYSIVNAGAPGRYSASDANNGGSPGTVRDKVTNQMAEHRANAARMLGGSGAPLSFGSAVPAGGPQSVSLADLFGSMPGVGFDMGSPVAQQQPQTAAKPDTRVQARNQADQARRMGLADLIRY